MRVKIEDYDPLRHQNPMWYIDDEQRKRHGKAPTLNAYKVCLVSVCSFEFVFHSLEQLELCLDYYRREHHPSSRLPVYVENLGGDHWEMQRWFEQLPQYLLEKAKRAKVVAALEKARDRYAEHASARTGTKTRNLYDWV
jgi:hypothetical protein